MTNDILKAAEALPIKPDDADLRLMKSHIEGGPFARPLLNLDQDRLAIMDRHGVDMQVLALASPGVQLFDAATGTALAVSANDELADAVARHPDRYVGLAAVAPQDPDAAAKEIERAVNKLGMRGIIINSHTHGEYLDQPKFRPILEAAAALDVPIYIHPRAPSPALATPFRPDLELAIWGYQVETSLHAMRMIIGGVFDAVPDLKIILGHGGEGIPFWLDRIDVRYTAGIIKRNKIARLPSEYFKDNFTITTSGLNWNAALRFCIDVIGADNMMFAVDYPFEDTAFMVDRIENCDFSDQERASIYHGTAEQLFRIGVAG